MAPVYSTRFFAGALAPAGSLTTLYTVPAGKVAILRDLDGISTAGAAGSLYFGTGSSWWWWTPVGASPAGFQWRGRQVLVAGETFQAQTVTSTVQMHVSGYLLDA